MTSDCLDALNIASSGSQAVRGCMAPIMDGLFNTQLVTQLSDGLLNTSIGQLFARLIIADDKPTSALSVFQDPA